MSVDKGKLRKQVNERATAVEVVESAVVPTSLGDWGAYSVRLEELPLLSYGVAVSGLTEVTALPVAADEFYVDYRRGIVTFHSSMEDKGVSITYKGRGSLVDAYDVNVLSAVANVPFYFTGIPEVTAAASYMFKIPLGIGGSGSQFGACDIDKIYIQGVTIQAETNSGDVITGDTTIAVSNKVMAGSGATLISATLTHTGAETDRNVSETGEILVAPDTQAVYVHCTAAGGHGDISGWIWFRRVTP